MPPRLPVDRTYLGLTVGLLAVGLVMLLSASGPVGHQRFGDGWYFFRHQLLFGLLPGVIFYWVARRIDYRIYRQHWPLFLAVSIGLLLLVFIPGLAGDWSHTHSWIRVLGVSVQPVEPAKLTFLLFLAGMFAAYGPERIRDLKAGVLPFVGALGVVCLLIILQPDLGSLTVVAGAAFIAWFVAGAGWKHLFGLAGLGLAGLAVMAKAAPYRAARLTTFLHPELDPMGKGYHINQAALAIGSGGWFGLGLGHSRQKFLYLPETFGDSIFAVMAEELGFVMTLAFLVLLFALFWRGLSIARQAPDSFGRILAAGIVGWLFCQSVFNIASMLGLLPITGLPLPFVSYGGSSLAILMAALGVLANISSHTDLALPRRA